MSMRSSALSREKEIFEALDAGATSYGKIGEQIGFSGEYTRLLVKTLPYPVRAKINDRLEQNRAGTYGVEAFGELKTVAAWAQDRRCVVTRRQLHDRLAKKWSLEEAMVTPMLATGQLRESLRPNGIPAVVVAELRRLCALATQVRGWTPHDSPLRTAAFERDALVRELIEAGHSSTQIAEVTGYSTHAVKCWMGYTGWRERYAWRKP